MGSDRPSPTRRRIAVVALLAATLATAVAFGWVFLRVAWSGL